MNIVAAALWRRLDLPGHDAARLLRTEKGWHLEGRAVFGHALGPTALDYAVDCDAAWRTLAGLVHGHIGTRDVDHRFARREDGEWLFDGVVRPGLSHLVDLDLGFTPATNILPLRRVPLAPGEPALLPAAWFDPDAGALTELPQCYERRSGSTVWYESPTADYRAMLDFSPDGFVRLYPGLWEREEGCVSPA